MGAGLFRSGARARGPAAERLDERIRVAGPLHWLTLAATIATIAGAAGWAFLGHVDRETNGAALITADPHVAEVKTDRAGVVTSAPRALGTTVQAGKEIARIDAAEGGTEDVAVRSPASGRIVSWIVPRNELVSPDDRIALVEPEGPLVAYLFVSVEDGKRLRPGMAVRLAPAGTEPSDDGLLRGTVESVSPYPVDEYRVEELTVQPHLTQEFLAGEARFEVDVRLDRDPSTRTGLSWTNGRGPGERITPGTVAAGNVVIGEERPIELLLGD